MRAFLGFPVGGEHRACELDPDNDRAAIQALGQRSIEYLRQTMPDRYGTDEVLRQFLRSVKPAQEWVEHGVLLGIHRLPGNGTDGPGHLIGMLYFLHRRFDPHTWHIALLLLEPAARGQGLGGAVHAAFTRWAAARGARKLTATVCETNRRAMRFWRDRMGYAETDAAARQPPVAPFRRSHDLEYRLKAACAPAPWVRLRVA